VEGRPLEEDDLIERSRNGDVGAFEQLVRTHQVIAIRVAFLVVRDHAEAEDVTQDAFVKAHGALHRFKAGSSFRPWLLTIVRNEAINRVRSSRRRERLALREAIDPVSGGAAPSPETVVVSRSDQARVLVAIDELPEPYRAVITHRFLLEMSEQEAAAVLRIRPGTVKSRTSRGLARLRELLGEDELA
jgi:RNA polymerase sigma-70 factor (ECF subfamily)